MIGSKMDLQSLQLAIDAIKNIKQTITLKSITVNADGMKELMDNCECENKDVNPLTGIPVYFDEKQIEKIKINKG